MEGAQNSLSIKRMPSWAILDKMQCGRLQDTLDGSWLEVQLRHANHVRLVRQDNKIWVIVQRYWC